MQAQLHWQLIGVADSSMKRGPQAEAQPHEDLYPQFNGASAEGKRDTSTAVELSRASDRLPLYLG